MLNKMNQNKDKFYSMDNNFNFKVIIFYNK